MNARLMRRPCATALLNRLIETPELVRAVRALPGQAFASLVCQVGVEDAGEIVALASSEQLVSAFDEDLFVNDGPGERESLDAGRFAVWLQVLLEAGDQVAANRVAELSEDFVAHALSSLVWVFDYDALMACMGEGGQSALLADKALESSLVEEIDGYLLVARVYDGWDATLALILALDRDHRPLLQRVLDRCSAAAGETIDDLDALAGVLSSQQSLAEDVEAEREDRRSKQGYVAPRDAKSFLALAQMPVAAEVASEPRDPITRAYFRDLAPRASASDEAVRGSTAVRGPFDRVWRAQAQLPALPMQPDAATAATDALLPFFEAMQRLDDVNPERFQERMEELAYLANVLTAGARIDERRLRPGEAAEAALATVALGAELSASDRRADEPSRSARATTAELLEVLAACPADWLYRRASSALAARASTSAPAAFVFDRSELARAIQTFASLKRTAPSGS